MFYSLVTHDRFYFRGSGENIAGQHHTANSVFPPTLQTMYGAIRGNWIDQHGNYPEFMKGVYTDTMGTIDSPGNFKLKGIYLAKDNQLYIPLPLDNQISEKEGKYYARPLLLSKGQGWESDHAHYRFIAQNEGKSKDNHQLWVAVNHLADLHANHEVECFALSHFVMPEEKIGIGLNPKTSSVQEGMLYQFTGYYLKENVSLVVNIEQLIDLAFIRFGNSGTMWSITSSPQYGKQFELLSQQNFKQSTKYLRVTTLTPAIITGDLVENQTHYRWNSNNRLVQMIVPRAQRLAGWDMAKRAPKPKYAMLEAGTTFIVEATENTSLTEQAAAIASKPHTDLMSEAGFGQLLVTPFTLFKDRK